MLIFQKNFNTVTVPEISSPWLRENVSLPTTSTGNVDFSTPRFSMNHNNSSYRPDSVNSSVNPDLQGFVRNPVEERIARTRAAETDAILTNNAQAYNNTLLGKLIRDHDAREHSNAVAITNNGQNLAEIKEAPVIDSTVIEEAPFERPQADVAKTATKGKLKDLASKAKDSIINGYGKLAESYGEGITGSLGTDAALAAGGLALAGGAYHLLRKQRAKKKAKKEALEDRIKK